MTDMNDQKNRIIGKIKRGQGFTPSQNSTTSSTTSQSSSEQTSQSQPVNQTTRRKGCGCNRKRKGG